MLIASLVGPLLSLLVVAGEDEPEPDPALLAAVERAEAHEKGSAWSEAAYAWSEAFDRDPAQVEFMRRAGLAAWEAKDCPKAKRLLDAIVNDESLRTKDRHAAQDVLAEIEGQECAKLSEEQATELAREKYEAAEAHVAEEPGRASYEYEDAYYLVPGKHGFAFKVGTSAFEAKICSKAEQYLTHFSTYGDPVKHADMMQRADELLNRLETMGCQDEAPPPVAAKGCAMAGSALDGGAGVGGLAWLLLVAGRRRRRGG